MVTDIFREVLLLSLLGSLVAGAILAVKAVFRLRLSARLHYYIWVLLLLRLAIPFTPDTPISLVRLPQPQAAMVQTHTPPAAPDPATAPQAPGNPPSIAKPENTSAALPDLWPAVLRYSAWVWLAGAVGMLAHMAAVNLLFWRRLQRNGLRGSRQMARAFARCKSLMGIHADLPLLLCPLARAPMLFGLFRPKVLLSAELADALTPQQLDYVLLHELTHWKRRDLLLHTLANLLRAVYWFNPLLWYAIGRMKQDCEIACDDTVLRGAAVQDRQQYGRTILDMMSLLSCARRIPGTVGFVSNYHRRRIQMIAQNRKTSWLCTGAAALAVLAILAGCTGTTLPADAAAGLANTATPAPTPTADATDAAGDPYSATPAPTPTPTGTADSSGAEEGPMATPVPTATTPAPTPTPAPTATPAPTPTPPTGNNRYDVSGIEDPAAFESWYHQLQDLVRAGDKNAVAAQVRYPIAVKLNQKATRIEDKAAFVKNYDLIFTDKVKAALLNTEAKDSFVNYKGVSVSQGELWFTAAVADSGLQTFAIYGINN